MTKYNPEINHRRSIRLKGYDYSQAGAYYVTICTNNRECLFGDVKNGKMELNNAGWMVEKIWFELPKHYVGVGIDAFQIMPNHIHCIIIFVGAGPCACPDDNDGMWQSHNGIGQPQGVAPTILSLAGVIHRFKTMTTKQYIDCVRQHGWKPFQRKLWQRNYYEHIIRNEKELTKIREYIINNPLNWETDENYQV